MDVPEDVAIEADRTMRSPGLYLVLTPNTDTIGDASSATVLTSTNVEEVFPAELDTTTVNR
mgnify:CR=1 FL=1